MVDVNIFTLLFLPHKANIAAQKSLLTTLLKIKVLPRKKLTFFDRLSLNYFLKKVIFILEYVLCCKFACRAKPVIVPNWASSSVACYNLV